jgi:acid phosphatase
MKSGATRRLAFAGLLAFGSVISARAGELPHPDHIVVVIEENKAYDEIIGSPAAPYINLLARRAALFTDSHGIGHPSQPNYVALVSGSSHDIQDDHCPIDLEGPNLASEMQGKGLSFAIYSETLPQAGYTGCFFEGREYARKHNPIVNWQGRGVAEEANQPFTAFPADFTKLPRLAFVVPNQSNDMHDGPGTAAQIRRGDDWLRIHLSRYVAWADAHNSMLIVTWDEDEGTTENRIATLFVGPMVKPGEYATFITHYDVLRLLEEIYGLPLMGASAKTHAIGDVWR